MTNILSAAAAVTAVLTGVLTLTWTVWRKAIRPAWRQFADMLADWHGEPPRPGVPARPGVMSRLQKIEGQLMPNGGTSTRDAVDRIEQALADTSADNNRKDHP